MLESISTRIDRYIEAYQPHPTLQGIPVHPSEFEETLKAFRGRYRGHTIRKMGDIPEMGAPIPVFGRYW